MDSNYLDDVRKLPVRLYSPKEMAKMLRISTTYFRAKYANKLIYPVKVNIGCRNGSGPRKSARTYYTDQDLIKVFKDRFLIPKGKDKDLFIALHGKKKV